MEVEVEVVVEEAEGGGGGGSRALTERAPVAVGDAEARDGVGGGEVARVDVPVHRVRLGDVDGLCIAVEWMGRWGLVKRGREVWERRGRGVGGACIAV